MAEQWITRPVTEGECAICGEPASHEAETPFGKALLCYDHFDDVDRSVVELHTATKHDEHVLDSALVEPTMRDLRDASS